MADVEQTRMFPRLKMFRQYTSLVLYRHFITGERDHFSPKGIMERVQRCSFEIFVSSHGVTASSTTPSRLFAQGVNCHNAVAALLDAPSVLLPERIIPSAGAVAPLSRVHFTALVLRPESFRGGCSFGVGNAIACAELSQCGAVSYTRMVAVGKPVCGTLM